MVTSVTMIRQYNVTSLRSIPALTVTSSRGFDIRTTATSCIRSPCIHPSIRSVVSTMQAVFKSRMTPPGLYIVTWIVTDRAKSTVTTQVTKMKQSLYMACAVSPCEPASLPVTSQNLQVTSCLQLQSWTKSHLSSSSMWPWQRFSEISIHRVILLLN